MMKKQRQRLGALGEKIAADYLRNKGYEILGMNYFNRQGKRLGEIDIVAKDTSRNEIVFVEVKSRDQRRFGDSSPEENITEAKLHKLDRIAQIYMKNPAVADFNYRFDALSVWIDKTARIAKIKHLKRL
ncbi:MAG: YraN family protein [Candidatus Moranbacteria bacterium]|nr:YraN family protein [Candidatus Moranbacteria bacterium]